MIIGIQIIKAVMYMTRNDLKFTPHSDVCLNDLPIINQHSNLIKENKLGDATNFLDDNGYYKGFRASLFNSIQNKIKMIQEYFLNKVVANKDEYYSFEEPDEELMKEKGYKFWVQPY